MKRIIAAIALVVIAATAHAVRIAVGGDPTPIATTEVAGKVKPDGASVTVDGDGTISSVSNIVFNKYSSGSYVAVPGNIFVGPVSPGDGANDIWLDTSAETEHVNILDYLTADQRADVVSGTGGIDVTASVQSAIDSVSTHASFSPSPYTYTPPYWSGNPTATLVWPKGVYRIDGTLTFHGDNTSHVGYGAVLNLRNDGVGTYFNHFNYGKFKGFQLQVFVDTPDTKAISLDDARWNVFEDLLIIYQGTYAPYALPTANSNEGIYAAAGPDFSHDVLYNRFDGVRIAKMGWAVHMVNDPAGDLGAGATLAQNTFNGLVAHSHNGIWLEGVKGCVFNITAIEGGIAGNIPFKLKYSGVNSTASNQFNIQWFEYTQTPVFDIDTGGHNSFKVVRDNFSNFSYTGNIVADTQSQWLKKLAAGGGVYLKPGGHFIADPLAATVDAVYDDGSNPLQVNGSTRLGKQGAGSGTTIFTGANGQTVVAHDSGFGGVTLAGSGPQSSAALTLMNNYTVTPTEKYRIALDGVNNLLTFSYGATPGSAPTSGQIKATLDAGGRLDTNSILLGTTATDDGTSLLQVNGNTRIGRSGGSDTTNIFTGASGQVLFNHASGQGGLTLAGTASTSNAALTLSNNYSGTLAEKFRISLDGSNNWLLFSYGATPGSAPTSGQTKWVMDGGGVFRPSTDGSVPIGDSTHRTQNVFSVLGDFSGKVSSVGLNVGAASTPASSSAACTVGDQAWDASYIYQCVATNTWKRAAITTW